MGKNSLNSFLLSTKATDQQILDRSYSESKVPIEEIIQLIQKYDPSFTVTDADRARFGERKEISQRARQAMLTHERAVTQTSMFRKYRVEGKEYNRHDRCLFDFSDSPQREENNQKFAKLRFGSDRKALGQYAFERVMEAQAVILRLQDASLEQLIEENDVLGISLERIMEIPNIIKDMGDGLSEEQIRQMRVAEMLMIQATEMSMRVDLAACPLYAQLPLERVNCETFKDINFLEDIKQLAAKYGEPVGEIANARNAGDLNTLPGPTVNMGIDLYSHAANKGPANIEALGYRMAAAGGDPRGFFYPNGEQITSRTKAYELVLEGETVLAAIPGLGLKTVKIDTTAEIQKATLGDEERDARIGQNMARQIGEMVEQIKGSSPWWMVTGSREFSAMEKAMQDLARAAGELTYPVEEKKAAEMKAICERAGECAQTYFEHKIMQRKDAISVGENGAYRGKNDRETKRLQAAVKLQEMSRQMNFLLSACADPIGAVDKIHRNLNEQERQKVQRAEEAARRRTEQQEREHQEAAKNLVPEEQRCKTPREEIEKKLEQIENTPVPKPEFENDRLPERWSRLSSMGREFLRHMEKNQPISDTYRMNLIDVMAQMVLCHMVQVERKAFREQHPAEPFRPGAVEQTMFIDRRKRLTNDPIFIELVGDITPARLEKFLMHEEYKTMGQTYLNRVAQKTNSKGPEKPPAPEHHSKKSPQTKSSDLRQFKG